MRNSRRVLLSVSAIGLMAFVSLWSSPVVGQDAGASGDVAPAVSGTGNAGRIAVWKNSTTLASSVMTQASGNVGVGKTAPASRLDVAGDINLSGIMRFQQLPLLQTLESNSSFSAGPLALSSITTGFYNNAIGANTLLYNTSGSDNAASGYNAMVFNTTGSFNTATGAFALGPNTTGNNNTADGWAALGNNTTGSNNIAIGYGAGSNVSNSNNIEIGNVGASSDTGTIRIGCTTNCAPGAPQTSAFIAGIYRMATGLAGVSVVVDANGQLGTVSSSRRYKEDIKDMGIASDGLMRLRPVTFRYKKPLDDGSKPVQYGLIAEEVAEVYPDLVARSADGQIETVKYQLLYPMLLNELQKQNVTIAAQKEHIAAQDQRIQTLEERLAKVEAALSGSTVTAAAR